MEDNEILSAVQEIEDKNQGAYSILKVSVTLHKNWISEKVFFCLLEEDFDQKEFNNSLNLLEKKGLIARQRNRKMFRVQNGVKNMVDVLLESNTLMKSKL